MLRFRSGLAVASAAVLVLLSGGCGPAAEVAGPDIVATVGGTPISRSQVESLMPTTGNTPVRVDGEPTPRAAALDLAIRDELLAREADRRGLVGHSRAEQIAHLIEQERTKEPRLTAATITDHQARAWYAQHRGLFDELATAEVSWAQFQEAEAAQTAFELASSDPNRSLIKLPDAGARRSGTARIADDAGADTTVLRIAHAVRRPGGIGLDQDRDQTWYLAQVRTVTFQGPRWDAVLAARVKTAMAWQRENVHLAALAEDLRQRWPVTIAGESSR